MGFGRHAGDIASLSLADQKSKYRNKKVVMETPKI